jgi:hypothetical protein
MASQVHDELYAEYDREPTEAEVVSRLKSRLEQARTPPWTWHPKP